MNIVRAIKDDQLFKPFLGRNLHSWRNWVTALRVLYGFAASSQRRRRLIKECTGRKPSSMPSDGFLTALFLVGRRSGKSRISAVVGAFEAALAGHEALFALR